MFCQLCGTEFKADANYCNRCGAAVGQSGAQGVLQPSVSPSPVSLTGAAWAVGISTCVTIIGGLVALFVGLAGLASWAVPPFQLGIIAIVGLLAIFGAETLLISQLPRLLAVFRNGASSNSGRVKQLGADTPGSLQPGVSPRSMSSVTDRTTYRLDMRRNQAETLE
jgi:hypothetical protein